MEIKFIKGLAKIKSGKKIIAKIYNREDYFKAKGLKNPCSKNYPFSITNNNSMKECVNLDECINMIKKYC